MFITIESSMVRQYRRLDAPLDSAVADGRKKQIFVAIVVAVPGLDLGLHTSPFWRLCWWAT